VSIRYVFALVALWGCKGDPDPPQLLDTGWFTDKEAPGCPHTVVDSAPADGDDGWYYRDAPRIFAATSDPAGYEAWLADAEGRSISTTPVWSEADSVLELVPDEPLAPGTAFELVVQDCERTHTIAFSTSPLGLPLDEGVQLAGRTYRLDLGGASWQRPSGLGPLIASFLSEPILLGVIYADDERIDLLGAPSRVSPLGEVSQADAPTWDFPLADFDSDEPTFAVGADAIELLVVDGDDTAAIPVSDFELSGTLASDGQRLGGGTLAGIADTREFADAFLGSETAICDLAETSFQLTCDPCASDGEAFCLALEATAVSGTQQPGLTLVDRSP